MPNKYSFKSKKKNPWRRVWCKNCEKEFQTRDQNKEFCNDSCRGKFWREHNEVVRFPQDIIE